MQILVLGMHRSGTSALTRVLNLMGAYVGSHESLTHANEQNPKGFWERRDLRSICDRTLESIGADWWKVANFDPRDVPPEALEALQGDFKQVVNELDVHRPWVVKEPRMSLLLSLYRPLLEMPVVVLCHRDPVEVAMSLKSRDEMPLPVGVALWERYTISALEASKDIPRVTVNYNELLDDPLRVLGDLVERLESIGVSRLQVPSKQELTSFLSEDLHRQRAEEDRWGQLLNRNQILLAEQMRDQRVDEAALALSEGAQEMLEAWEKQGTTNEEKRELRKEIGVARREVTKAEQQVDNARKRITEKEDRIAEVRKELSSVRKELSSVREELSSVREELSSASEAGAKTSAELVEANSRLATVSQQKNDAVRSLQNLRQARSVRMVLPVAQKLRTIADRIRPPKSGGSGRTVPMRTPTSTSRSASVEVVPPQAENRRLREELERVDSELRQLHGRRSVQAALKVGGAVRAALELRAGQLTVAEAIRASKAPVPPVRAAHPIAVAKAAFSYADALPTSNGAFYSRVRALIDSGVPDDFRDQWVMSETKISSLERATTEPLVSIILPTYQREGLIADAISSVTDQTHRNWELLVCDDGSTDGTAEVVTGFGDERISYELLQHQGAAAARNNGLGRARGNLIAYLDSDNLWHPDYLAMMVASMQANPGRFVAYAKYIDVFVDDDGMRLKKFRSLPFDYEELAGKNFIDLNSLVHRRSVFERLGGFNEGLVRQQDWDLILKYAFIRDPLYVDCFLTLYRRNKAWGQITATRSNNSTSTNEIRRRVEGYYRQGLPLRPRSGPPPSMTVLSWDVCRNHFSKAYNLAEAMPDPARVKLVGFSFFDEPVFGPYADAEPAFETLYLDGGVLPEWGSQMARAVAAVDTDVVYAVKPRLPSLGTALLANAAFGTPVILEANDLESVVTTPRVGQLVTTLSTADVDPADPDLANPYGAKWTALMEGFASRVPSRATHNSNLDDQFGGGAYMVRNPKDDRHFDPDAYDREATRAALGFGPSERVLLFGGMVRKHKGVFEFADLVEAAGPQYRLLVVGSRQTPDQDRLRKKSGNRVQILPPMDRNAMAKVNQAADAVVLWLDPSVPASHYQMPFKLTDALAMKVPVLANDIGDLGDLGRQGYVKTVPYRDHEALVAALHDLDRDRTATEEMVQRGRRLYLRQFSYQSVRTSLELILDQVAPTRGVIPVAKEFAEFFGRVRDAQGVGLGGVVR